MPDAVTDLPLFLRDLRNFFHEPTIDPFAGEDIDISGIDQIMDALKARPDWKRARFRAVVHLPPSAEGDTRLPEMPRLLQRYCARQIQYSRRKIAELRIEGSHALRIGLVFLAACLGTSAALQQAVGETSLIVRFLVESLVIAGWVALWHPLELLLYSWWPYDQDIKLYEKIEAMELAFAFDHREPPVASGGAAAGGAPAGGSHASMRSST